MHAKSIRYFDTIARSGSIREAARKLHVDASAVNRQLLNLEDELGTLLFERLPGNLRLTDAGKLFFQHVLHVLQDEQRLLVEMGELQGLKRGELRIAAVESLNADFLPTVVERMMKRYPNVHLQVQTLSKERIAEQLLLGDSDIGIVVGLTPLQGLKALCEGRFGLGAIMAPSHPLAAQRQTSVARCAAYPLILANRDLSLHALLAPLIAQETKLAESVLYTNSIELMRQLAMRGVGIAFHIGMSVGTLCQNGQLVYVPLTDKSLVSRLVVYVRAGRALPPAVSAFGAIVQEEIERLEESEIDLVKKV